MSYVLRYYFKNEFYGIMWLRGVNYNVIAMKSFTLNYLIHTRICSKFDKTVKLQNFVIYSLPAKLDKRFPGMPHNTLPNFGIL